MAERGAAANRAATSGSFFFAEISRTTSSLRPLGATSDVEVGDEAVLVLPVDEVVDDVVMALPAEPLCISRIY